MDECFYVVIQLFTLAHLHICIFAPKPPFIPSSKCAFLHICRKGKEEQRAIFLLASLGV
jgi:hypothetical protein